MITCKQQFDWIIKTGDNLIGQKINYLNTNIFKELKIKKSCLQKKCKQPVVGPPSPLLFKGEGIGPSKN